MNHRKWLYAVSALSTLLALSVARTAAQVEPLPIEIAAAGPGTGTATCAASFDNTAVMLRACSLLVSTGPASRMARMSTYH
ncbi:MAG: hypothetical protein ACRD2X_02410, partial [Vicinamibacteraceae bacterium]